MGSSFTFANRCSFTVWPEILANAGNPQLDSTGFELRNDTSRSILAPTGWFGRFGGRTGCDATGFGSLSFLTGNYRSGTVECNGLGATPPPTLAEFTLGNSGGQDFHDVSHVDSAGVRVCGPRPGAQPNSRSGKEKLARVRARRSGARRLLHGAYNSPVTCRPSLYLEMFKAACPRSYSHVDDKTSTFTCTGADYTATFCPSSPGQKTTSPTLVTLTTTTTDTIVDPADQGSVSIPGGMRFVYTDTGSGSEPGLESGRGTVMADETYLAGLEMGGSTSIMSPCAIHQNAIVALCVMILSIAHAFL